MLLLLKTVKTNNSQYNLNQQQTQGKSLKIWEIYPNLVAAIKRTHNETVRDTGEAMFYCHDFDHVIRVADMAMRIADDENAGRLAAVAALCHNADRILQKLGRLGPFGEVLDSDVVALVEQWLNNETDNWFRSDDRALIIDAVLHHPERNSETDSPVLVCLKDADRIVNTAPDIVVRKGQYFSDRLPVVDPVHLLKDPGATFVRPGSLMRAILFDVEDFEREGGVASLRLPKARKIAAKNFEFLRVFLNAVIEERVDSGLVPYPEELR